MKTLIIFTILLYNNTFWAQTVQDVYSISNPIDLKADSHGNVWVSHHSGTIPDTFQLSKITPGGILVTMISGPEELGQFDINDSIIWISSWSSGKVYKYTHFGIKLDSVNVNAPTGIILDSDGTWYLSQDQNDRILKYTPDNGQFILASGSPLNNNLGIARNENGLLYAANRQDANIIQVNPETGDKYLLASLPTASQQSVGLPAFHQGYIYVPSYHHCIYKINSYTGSYTVYAGSEGESGDQTGSLSVSRFLTPNAVAFSHTGDSMLISDAGNNKVKIISGLSSLDITENVFGGSGLQLYPNPASSVVHIRVAEETITSVSIVDPSGKTVITQTTGIVSEEISITAIPDGFYFLRATTETGNVYVTRLIKTGILP